jgi:trehalose synthase
MSDGDVLAVHDPQPLPLARQVKNARRVSALWRCHIGLDEETAETRSAWEFIRPYAAAYDQALFSSPEYVPNYLRKCARVIHPAIDPLAPKNRELSLHKLVGVLCNSALATNPGPVLTPPYPVVAERLAPDGSFRPANLEEDIGLLTRPIVTQISRWDRLKGWAPLLRAFAQLKAQQHEAGKRPSSLHRRRLELVRLVLAGPDPASIADDPEGREVIDELRATYIGLPGFVQRDIALVALPMRDRTQNALMVNAIQRASSIVVQNSLREGFGLTVTEAMWKQVPVVSNRRACGPRQQIRDGMDGRLIDDAEDVDELAGALDALLADARCRDRMGRSAQRRAHDEFMVFTQVRRWLEILAEL